MGENIQIKSANGEDIVQYLPQGVCSRVLQFRIKDDIIVDFEAVGGCSGNLGGIGALLKGMKLEEVAQKFEGIPCGNRPTSCPDQISKAINSYIEIKNKEHSAV